MSSTFLATHLSERTGKGIPLIISKYGRQVFQISDVSTTVTLPYNWVKDLEAENRVIDKGIDKPELSISLQDKMVLNFIKDNPHASQPEIAAALGIGKAMVYKSIARLKKMGTIQRVGSNKTGFWSVE